MKTLPLSCCFLWLALDCACLAQEATAAKSSKTFERDVYPLLQRACFECHGAKKQEGDLRLDQRDAALLMIEPGRPDESELLRRVLLPRGHDDIMPAIGEPLTESETGVLRRWIASGAEWPEDFTEPAHWAYVRPRQVALPSTDSDWVRNPIDRFVLQTLDARGLTPSPQAAPDKLLRRLFLDLIGLPPTPSELESFRSDPSRENYERFVDDLLRRPQFGERWARPWLDLARYADSHGFQRDNLRDIWAYRDWVIRALNDDMPFDQFSIEQIAGDLLPDASESQKIATGFHRCTPTNVEAGSLPEETRIEQVIDRVNTTGAVWLGTTLECCQCHDHKYDPFSMREYYQLLAFFNNTELEADRTDPKKASSIQFKGPSMPLSNAERDQQRSELEAQLDELKRDVKQRKRVLADDLETWATQLATESASSPKTHTLSLYGFQSKGTTDSHQVLEDGSILLTGGDPPDKDEYTVLAKSHLKNVSGFRLDALRHDSLPGGGPGRGDPVRTNFVLNDFSVELKANSSKSGLELVTANADFSQKNWDVAEAIDSDPKSGWAISPKLDESHWATFALAAPIDLSEQDELVFRLRHEYGRARSLGRFKLSAITGNFGADAIPESIAKIIASPAEAWTEDEQKQLADHRSKSDAELQRLDREKARLEKAIEEVAADTTLVMIELGEPRMSTVFERGDYRKPGDSVMPGTPAVLHQRPEGPGDRLTLARWLVSPENPLAARVTVNRWWAELFGQGIVPTLEDFGVKGKPPSHPELLDWLAVEFMDQGWSMKWTLKTIVMSATYQQSSAIPPSLQETDDRNVWLARGPRFRMDAEMIRDNALAISGLLNLKQFGPPIRPYQPKGIWSKVGGTSYDYEVSSKGEQFRRGLYVVLKRGSPYPSFVTFDATPRLTCTVKRSRTNTPLQALTLMNDPVYVELAQGLADRVATEAASRSPQDRIAYAFQICTGRLPNRAELQTLITLFESQLEAWQSIEPDQSQSPQSAESQAWYSVASVLLNLHETITKD